MDIFNLPAWQKFTWIELTGFDRNEKDFGVNDFLTRAGFTPTGVSLLLYWVGFVFSHDGLKTERCLSPAEASYGGHPYAPERPRQAWTNMELKGLIDELHQHGIKGYMSFFNLLSYSDDEGKIVVHPAFADCKDVISDKNREGQSSGGIGMLKRMPDGSYFEDALIEKTVQAMNDYGFDGLQIADGISSPRIALEQGDYSRDMLEQFSAYSGISLPEDGKNAADWIWKNHRLDWIYFHTVRWETFYRKFMNRILSIGKEAIFNSAWTRDPFEAMYRYGIDYRRISQSGICGCMVEDTSANLAILSEQDNLYLMTSGQREKVHYEFLTALMLNRAVMPDLHITSLAGIHDTMEQWGVLEHMPTAMIRNIMNNLCTFLITDKGLKPITDGPFFCLSDGLSVTDWSFIRKQWNTGVVEHPVAISGVTIIWSDKRLDNELKAFVERRTTPTHRFVSELMYAGAPVYSVARIEHIDSLKGPILVTNPALLPEDEMANVCAYRGGKVFLIGEGAEKFGFSCAVSETNTFGNAFLSIRDGKRVCVTLENRTLNGFDPQNSFEKVHSIWTHPLYFLPISEAFFLKCADVLNQETSAPEVKLEVVNEMGKTRRPCKCIMVFTEEKKARVLLTNDDYYYNIPEIDLKRKIQSITCLTKYKGFKVGFTEQCFHMRVPGRGAEAFEAVFE